MPNAANSSTHVSNDRSKCDIHATAVVSPNAIIGEGSKIGPFCVVGDGVVMGKNNDIRSHVVIEGNTHMGDNNIIFSFAAIGSVPQDLKYNNEPSKLIIGSNNRIREYVTMHPGTEGGGMLTSVGSNCLFMVGVHIAHDCHVGNHVIMANNATIAGHVTVGDFAIIGGLSAVKQFVRIGHHAMIGGMSGIENDVIPFGQANGERATLSGLNLVGLKRRGFSRDSIHILRNAYRFIFSPEGTLAERVSDAQELFKDEPAIQEIIDFIENDRSKAICQPKGHKLQEQE